MVLSAIRAGGYFPFAHELPPPEICVIDGPALSVAKSLERFQLDHLTTRSGKDQE